MYLTSIAQRLFPRDDILEPIEKFCNLIRKNSPNCLILKIMKKLVLFLVGIASLVSFAQDGSLDTSFGNNGIVQTDVNGGSDLSLDVAQQSDGKLVVCGRTEVATVNYPSLIRYLPNGEVDTSFGGNGTGWVVDSNIPDKMYNSIHIQPSDDIIVTRSYWVGGNYTYVVNRYSPDGILDATFGNGGELIAFTGDEEIGDMKLLNDGSILFTGTIMDNGQPKIAFKKYLPDGTPDLGYGTNGVITTDVGSDLESIENLLLLDNGSIITLAYFTVNTDEFPFLLRFSDQGVLDTTYGNNGRTEVTLEPEYSISDLATYNDGKIAVLTRFFDFQFEQIFNQISRYLPNGDFDTSFGNNGIINPNISNLSVNQILVQENQRLLVFGELTDFFEGGGPFFLRRYHLGGDIDNSFNFNTPSFENFVTNMMIQQDGKIVCLANTPWYNGPEDIIMERHNNNPLSVPEQELQQLKVFPNPSNGIFTVAREFYSENDTYQITDITGKIITSGELNDKQTELDFSTLQNGIYFLKSSSGVFRLLKN